MASVVEATVGRGFPLGLIKYHDMFLEVELRAPCNGVRALFSVGRQAAEWAENNDRYINKCASIVTVGRSEPLRYGGFLSFKTPYGGFYPYKTPFGRSDELFVLIERSDTGAIVDDVLDTLCVKYITNSSTTHQDTFPATALRGSLHSAGRWIRSGYVVPIENAFNFSRCDLSFRLALRAGVDPTRFRVTFAHIQTNYIRVMSGMVGFMFSN